MANVDRIIEILYECTNTCCSNQGHIFMEKIPQDQKAYEIKILFCPWCNCQMSTKNIKESDYNIKGVS